MGADSGSNKVRKAYLVKQKLISCGHCAYNRGENRRYAGKREKRRDNRYKDHRKG